MAQIDLGLTEREFLKLTLRDLHGLYQRHLQHRKHAKFIAAVLGGLIVNFGFRAPKTAVRPSDIFPDLREDSELDNQIPSADSQVAQMRSWVATLGTK